MKKSDGPTNRGQHGKWAYIHRYLGTQPVDTWYEEQFETREVAVVARASIYGWYRRHPRTDGRFPEVFSKGKKLFFRLSKRE